MRDTFRSSITVRTLVVGALVAAALGSAFLVLVVAVQGQRDAARRALRSQEAVSAGQELEKSLINMENGLRGYVASGRERLLQPFRESRDAYPAQIRALTNLVADEPGQQRAVRQMSADIDDYVTLWALPLLSVARERAPVARSVLATGTGRERLDDLRARFATLFTNERKVAAAREARAETRSDLAVGLGMAGVGLVILLAFGAYYYLRRSVLRPVAAVASASETVASGDLTARVPSSRDDELGRLARAFNTMTEALERNREELQHRTEDLESSNRELEQYAQVTSHDLQAPLATIRLYVDVLGRRLSDEEREKTQELLDGIIHSLDRMRALIRDLLEYSRAGRGVVAFETVRPRELLEQALENLAAPIADRGAEVISEDDLPAVSGDRSQLTQVFQNLIGNAVKFSDERAPRVQVTGRAENGFCHFSVIDNGIGIDPVDAEKIFEPFQRLQSEERYEGTGIGLAICQKVVAAHGGRIWAEGEPGVGSAFHFTLPRAGGELPAPQRSDPTPATTNA